MGRAGVDERGFEALRRIREKYTNITLAEFKATVREQFYMLLLDTEAALSAIPVMLPLEPETRQEALDLIKAVLARAVNSRPTIKSACSELVVSLEKRID